jgi:pimeloyl-ACP methyl ester carboxylesterase
MPHIAVADMMVHYEEYGQSDSPPLVLLHNFTGTGAMWRSQVAALGAHHRLLVPDWRGHGRTANPGGLAAMNHRQFTRDIAAFCRALGVERATFCGASSGAMLLLTLGLEAPELAAALVLAGATYHFPEGLLAWKRGLTPEGFLRQFGDSAADLPERHAPLGPDGWRTVVEAFGALGHHTLTDDFPEQDELRGITAPTLIIHGDRDPLFPIAVPTTLYGLLPDAELCILPRTGHMPPVERPEWFNAIALEFLARRQGGGLA